MEIKEYYYKFIVTPVGKLKLIGSENGLFAILWEDEVENKYNLPTLKQNDQYALFLKTEKQMKEYFDGKRKDFDLKLDLNFGTSFQRNTWKALTEIPYGEVRTYGEQAVKVGNPKAFRAVGNANGKNPLPIVVPCHRVIASGGRLGGFGGGLSVKKFLLNLEKQNN